MKVEGKLEILGLGNRQKSKSEGEIVIMGDNGQDKITGKK